MPRIKYKRDKFGQFARVNSLLNFKGKPKGKRKSPKRKPLQTLTDGGERDISRTSVSALKRERQELHAKIKGGKASDSDHERLKDVQVELKTRGLNRKKDAPEPKPKPEPAKKVAPEPKSEPESPRLDEYRLFSPGRLKKERARLRAKESDGTATPEDLERLQEVRDRLSAKPKELAPESEPEPEPEPELPKRTAADVHRDIRQKNQELVEELGKINFDREGGPNEEDRRQYREKVTPIADEVRRLEEESAQLTPDRSRSVMDAKTPEELQEIMQDRHPATVIADHVTALDEAREKAYERFETAGVQRYRVDLTGAISDRQTAFKALQSHMRGLDAMMAKYPGVKIAAIDIADIPDATNESGSGRVGAQCYRIGHHTRIELNSRTLTDVAQTVRRAKTDDERTHFHPKGWSRASYRFNAIHEFGHALDQFANLDPKNEHKTALDRDLMSTRVHFELADVLAVAYRQDTGSDKDDDPRAFSHWLFENMSGYSIRNQRNDDPNDPIPDVNMPEAIAEAFADVEFNKDDATPSSKAIHAWMIRKLQAAGHHPQDEKPLSEMSVSELIKLKKETDSQDLKDEIRREQDRRYIQGQEDKLKNETPAEKASRERAAEHRSRTFKQAKRGVR